MRPEISVVIPLYNKKRYIQRTIDSVLRQSFQNFECIIVDSSNDGSSEIVRGCTEPRIRHIIQEKRTSPSIGRNVGTSLAKADLIAFIDADDEWMPGHLEAICTLSKQFPDAGVFATPYIKLRPGGKPMVMIFADIPPPPWEGKIQNYFRTCSRGDVPVSSSSSAVRRIIFNEMGGFDETLIHGGEDQHFWGRIALTYPIAFTWNGPAIYHTEALGRFCNNIRPYFRDPFSTHLEELLASGKIPVNQIKDIKAYIRRRNKTVWFSQLLGMTERKKTGLTGANMSKKSVFNKLYLPFSQLFSQSIKNFIDTQLFNAGKGMWCYLHGWHIPTLDEYQ